MIEGVDHAELFAVAPSPYAVLDRNLMIVEANRAYCATTGRSRADLLGTKVLDSFPDDPTDPASRGSHSLRASLEQVLSTGRAHTMAPQRYDVSDATGAFTRRYWSIVNVPVLDRDGQVVQVLHRPEEITVLVTGADEHQTDTPVPDGDVYVRAQELQAAWQAEADARARLRAVSDVALRLAHVQTVQDLVAIVIDHGLGALGADGGAVAVRDGEHLDLILTSSLGEHTQVEYGRLPLHGPLPACVATVSGTPVVLGDRAASLAFAPQMRGVLADTGCQAWVSLPLYATGSDGDGVALGSLTIGWAQPHEFPAAELDVLHVLAAQCGYGLGRIQQQQHEQEAALRVRRLSETLQRSMLTAPFQPNHLELVVRYTPAALDTQVGGDWYDAFMIHGALCMAVGDVAGHDRDAAATMGQLRNLLRGIAYAVDQPPAAVVDTLDAAMAQLGIEEMASAIFGKIEQTPQHGPGQRTLRWVNAGHPPPLLVEPDGTVRLLHTPPELLLARIPDAPARTDHTHLLEPGSTVLLYTDGLIERRGADLDAGFAWLAATVSGLSHRTLDELCDGLLAAVGDDLDDDVALLAVRAHPEDRPRPPEAGPSVVPPTTR